MWWFIYWSFRIDKKGKKTINPKNKEDQFFQYVVTVGLNYGEIESYPPKKFQILNPL